MNKDINACIMFSDIKGYSGLRNPEIYSITVQLFKDIAEILNEHKDITICKNTWGDGLFLVFNGENIKEALSIALDIRDLCASSSNKSFEYNPVEIRTALHYGLVRIIEHEPISGNKTCIGQDVIQAARIEPKVLPNHIFASKNFYYQLLSMSLCPDPFKALELKKIELAKGRGEEDLVWLVRANEKFNRTKYLELKKQSANYDLIPIFTYSDSEKIREDIYLLADRLAKKESGAEFYSLFINSPNKVHKDYFHLIEKHVKKGKLRFLRTLNQLGVSKSEVMKGKYTDYYHAVLDPLLSESRALQEILPNAIIYIHKKLDAYRAFLSFCDMKGGYGLGLYTQNKDIVLALQHRFISYQNKLSQY